MIPQQTPKQAQLPLPFHPRVTASLTDDERDQLRLMLAQLLLSASGIRLEAATDER